jgi:hypothetical protein
VFAHTKSEQLCTIHITIILLGVENHLIIKGATCGTEMAYPSGAQEFIPCAFSGVSVARYGWYIAVQTLYEQTLSV